MSIQAIIAPANSNSNGGGDQTTTGASNSAPAAMPSSSGHNTGMAGTASNTPAANTMPSASDTATGVSTNARPQITAKTEGVIGISGLTLAPAQNATQGSLLSSEKSNVKLESGTIMLLRVNQ